MGDNLAVKVRHRLRKEQTWLYIRIQGQTLAKAKSPTRLVLQEKMVANVAKSRSFCTASGS